MELDDCFFLVRFQPEIKGNPTVVLVDAPVPPPPIIELGRGHAQPRDEATPISLGGGDALETEKSDIELII